MSTLPAADTTLLEVRGLSRYFGSRVALEGVDFSVSSSELLLVLGGNGAGKSTLLAVLAGLLAPSRGGISFFSQSNSRVSAAQRRALAYVAERPMLYEDLQLQESLKLIAKSFGDEGLGRFEQAMEEFELGDQRTRLLRECSQGVRRRASLARGFIGAPRLWLLDEPFVHLDSRAQERLMQLLLRERSRGATILLATHESDVIQAFPERFLCLDQGRLRSGVQSIADALSIIRETRA